eukprot:COSAG02_NODE_676_length_18610_cov_44.695532_19_plen_93_part_00
MVHVPRARARVVAWCAKVWKIVYTDLDVEGSGGTRGLCHDWSWVVAVVGVAVGARGRGRVQVEDGRGDLPAERTNTKIAQASSFHILWKPTG